MFLLLFFFFNDTATTEIYTLSLHDALPISDWPGHVAQKNRALAEARGDWVLSIDADEWVTADLRGSIRSEEHTSELQSQSNLVCRLLLEKKKKKKKTQM